MCFCHPKTIPYPWFMEKLSFMKPGPWCQKGWGPLWGGQIYSDQNGSNKASQKAIEMFQERYFVSDGGDEKN